MKPFLAQLPEILLKEIELGRAAVVGGAIRCSFEGKPSRDIDVFIFDKDNHQRLVKLLEAQPKEKSNGHVFVLNRQTPIELVCLPGWNSPEVCLAKADFNVAAGVYSKGRYFLPKGYAKAVKNKNLRFSGSTDDPQASYDRFIKYNRKYGYVIDESINALLLLWQQRS